MRLTIRPADPKDVEVLVGLYDRHYRGGYSACFDRYGPVTPQDFWWVQSEKSVHVLEANHHPVGFVILGKAGKQLLVEELVSSDADEASLRHVHQFLMERFQRERQDFLTLRCAETNPFVLTLAHRFGFAFANALLVATGGTASPSVPEGYHVRRATVMDAKNLARVHEETLGTPIRLKDLDLLWKHADTRVLLVEREKYAVGFALAQIKDGVGRWTVGVREAHRRKGIATALAHAVFQHFHPKDAVPVGIYWALDGAAAGFMCSLGSRTERTYLYFEKRL